MNAGETFRKTPKGQSEIETRSRALSMKERRVLILVNGQNDLAKLKDFSLCEDISEIVKRLLDLGFIESTGKSRQPSSTVGETPQEDIGARELMINTLLTFGNRVRVAGLIEEINARENADDLADMVKPWYDAIAETPGGMYQVDDLRKEVLALIRNPAEE